jgi:ESCRT-I complex subunit VPS37
LLAYSGNVEYSSQQQQQPDPNFQGIPTQSSWYPPSVVSSSSCPSTPGSSSASPYQRASDYPQPSSRGQPSPAGAAGIIARVKDKRLAISRIFFPGYF